jgi:Phasin protein
MSDVKPKRTAREPGRSGISQGEPAPVRTAPVVPAAMVPGATVPEAPTVPQVVSATPEAAAPLAAAMVFATADPLADSPDDSWSADHPWTAFAEAQAALARGFEAIAVEIAGKTRSGIAAASDAAIALLGARTFSEAIDINAGLARRGVDAVIEGSAKLSDIGVKAVSEASRPMLARLGGARSSALRPIISHAAAR